MEGFQILKGNLKGRHEQENSENHHCEVSAAEQVAKMFQGGDETSFSFDDSSKIFDFHFHPNRESVCACPESIRVSLTCLDRPLCRL